MPLSGFHPSKTPSASAVVANVLMDAMEGENFTRISIHDLPNHTIDRLARRLAAAGWETDESANEAMNYVCVRADKDNVCISLFRPRP